MSARVFFLGVAVVFLIAVGSARAASPAPGIEIPAILSLTGSAAATGQEEAEALRLLAQSVNSGGGIRGQQLSFAISDDQSSPQLAVQLANQIITRKPPIIVGPTLSGPCKAIQALVRDAGPLTYCLSSGMYPDRDSYMFAQGVPTKETLRLQLKFYRLHGWKRIAAIFTNDATGQDFETNLDALLALPENRELTLVARERFGISDVSVSGQIATIKAASPQALIVWAVGNPLGTVFHAMQDTGMNVPTGTSGANLNAITMKRFNAILPPELYFINVPGLAPESIPRGPLRTSADYYYNTLTSAGLVPDAGYLLAWDPGVIVVNILKALGPDATAAQCKKYLEGLHGFFAASGEYDFRDGSQRGIDGRNDIVLRYDTAKQQFVGIARIGEPAAPIR